MIAGVLSQMIFGNLKAFAALAVVWFQPGLAIGKITEIYTSGDYRFVKNIARQSQTDRRRR